MKKIALASFAILSLLFYTSCTKDAPSDVKVTPKPVLQVDSLKIGLVAYYPLNNGGADSSGNGNDVYAYYNIVSTTNRANKPNSAFYFDGISSYMQVKDNAALRLSNTNFTISAWVCMDAYNSSYGSELLCKRGTGSSNGWNFSVNGSAIINGTIGAASFQVSGGTDPLGASGTVIPLGQWHMVTTVYDVTKKQLTFYIDGVASQPATNIPSPSANATVDLFIGADSQSGNYRFKGKMDELRIYSRAFTAAQVGKLYASTN